MPAPTSKAARAWLTVVFALMLMACGPRSTRGWVRAPAGQPYEAEPAEPRRPFVYDSCGSKPQLVVQDGAATMITVVAMSTNGRYLASTGAGNSIALWDTHSGLLLRRVPTDGPPEALAVSNDGEIVGYGWTDKKYFVRIVDVSGRRPPHAFDHGLGFALSPNGSRFALATKGEARLYDTATGSAEGLGVRGVRVAFGAGGGHVAVAGLRATRVVRLADRRIVETFEPRFKASGRRGTPPHRLHFAQGVLAMQWAGQVVAGILGSGGRVVRLPARGTQQAAAGGSRVIWPGLRGGLSVFDARTGRTTDMPPEADLAGAYRLAMSGDGTRLAVATAKQGRQIMRLRDGRSLAPIRSMEGQSSHVAHLAVGGDGRVLLTSARFTSQVAAWDLRSGVLLGVLPHTGPRRPGAVAPAIAVDARSGRLAVAGPLGVSLFDRKLKPLGTRKGFLANAQYLGFHGNELLAIGATGLSRWDLTRPSQPAARVTVPLHSGRIAVSPDGRSVAAAGRTGVELFDARDGRKIWSQRVPFVVTGDVQVAFVPDGTHVVATFEGREPSRGRGRFAPTKGRLLVLAARDGRVVSELHPGTAGPIAVHGGRIAIGGARPAILDWRTGRVVHRVDAPDQKITAVAAHPALRDGVWMAGDGGSTSLVSLTSGKVLAIMRATTNGEYVTATPDGLYRASVDGARSIAWGFSCPVEVFPFSQFAKSYARPDLIERALAGQHVKPPKPMTRPPHARIPERPPPTTDAGTFRLPVEVASTTRVKSVRVFVNGRAASKKKVGKARAALTLEVPLDPGRNRISVVAYDAAGKSSNAAVADIRAVAPTKGRPDLWVVAVGVSTYPKLAANQQLEVADDDARSIAEAFGRQAGPGRPYAKAHVTTLLDREVNVQSLTRALGGLRKMKRRDLAVVFLAGHGVKLKSGASLFLTSRASLKRSSAKRHGVGWDRLRASLAKARGRVLVLLDACHSGHLSTDNVVPNEALAQQLSRGDRGSVLVFAAARGRQLSYEVSTNTGSSRALELAYAAGGQRPSRPMPPRATGHGLFTAAVLEALEGAAVDIDKSGGIEVGEFVAYTSERVRVMSGGMQTPWVVRQEMFGDFPLAPAR